VQGGPYRSGAEINSTNQRMEIRAALDAVISLSGRLEVVSDSTYVVNCFRDRWWESWLAKGWLNKAKKPVKNRDLWQPLIDAYRADPQRIRFRWVKGHGTDPMNDLVDRLAVEAAVTQTGRAGTGTPEGLGPADVTRRQSTERRSEAQDRVESRAGPAPGDNAQLPPGHLLMVTGLKPPQLGGYADNPVAQGVLRRMTEILGAKQQLHADLTVLTGLGLGAEQLGAEAAARAGVPYVAVLAFPGVDEVWPAASRRHFAKLVEQARDAITLQLDKPATKQAAGGALARRDAWLARHAAEALAVWDGGDGPVGRAVRALQDLLGEDDVWVLEPSAP